MKSHRWGKRTVIFFILFGVLASSIISILPINDVLAFDVPSKVTIGDCTTKGGVLSTDKTSCSFSNSDTQNKSSFETTCNAASGNFTTETKMLTNTIASFTFTCVVPISATNVSDDLSIESANYSGLQDLLCADVVPVGGTVLSNCYSGVKNAYDSCVANANGTTGYVREAMLNANGIATCMKKAYPKFSVSDLEKATQDGYDKSESVANAIADKATCEKDGGTWDDTKNPKCTTKTATTESTAAPTCNLGALGWVICPTARLIEGMVGAVLGMVTTQMQFNAIIGGDTQEGMLSGWSAVRDIANVAFAIVFMIIIYSTATSSGLTNYSVKKIFPRLIIVAVLVNISFWICAAAVDLSNIVGSSIKGFIDVNMTSKITGTADENFGRSIATVVGGAFGVVATGIGLIVAGIMLWSSALIAILVLLAALAFRTFALVALIVISPIAFVAYLLPNTESWFKKWRTEFMRMLFAYPMVAGVWGLSNFLTAVLQQDGGAVESGGITFVDAILIPLIAFLPAAALLPILKSSGGLMGKMTNLAQRGINKAGGDQLRGLNKKSNAFLREGAANRSKNFTAGRINKADNLANEAEGRVKRLEADKASKYSQEDAARQTHLAGLGVRNAEEQEELDNLVAKHNANGNAITWNDQDEDQLINAQQQANVARIRHAKRANGLMYKTAFMASNMRFSKANRQAETKRLEQGELGRRLGSEAQNPKSGFMKRYSGVTAGMDSDSARSRMDRAFSQAQAIGNKETKEEVEMHSATYGNALVTRADGTKDTLSNSEYADLIAGTGQFAGKSEIEAKIGNQTVKIPVGEHQTRNQKLAMLQNLQSNGWASPEVAKMADHALKEEDPYVREALLSAVAKSGKADSAFGGAAVPAASAHQIDSWEEGAVLNFKGGVKGDPFGANVGASQMKNTIAALEKSQSHGLTKDGVISEADQDNFRASFAGYMKAQLNSENGHNIVNQPDKVTLVRRGLIASGVSATDADAWINNALTK